MGINKGLGLFLGVVCFSVAYGDTAASQDENSSKASVKSTSRKDIDSEITNARLRAITGSKNLLSLKTFFIYNGGPISDPFGGERKKLAAGMVAHDPSQLMGKLAAKYRVSDYGSINAGIGVGWLTPGHEGQKAQMENPFIGYGHLFRLGDLQNSSYAMLKKYTSLSAAKENLTYEFAAFHDLVAPFFKTKCQWGVSAMWFHEFRTDNDGPQDKIGLSPFIEYPLSSVVNFRTMYLGFTFFNTARSPGQYQHDDPLESTGLGISVTRDIYFYPNVQWVWTDMRADRTTVGLQANVNM